MGAPATGRPQPLTERSLGMNGNGSTPVLAPEGGQQELRAGPGAQRRGLRGPARRGRGAGGRQRRRQVHAGQDDRRASTRRTRARSSSRASRCTITRPAATRSRSGSRPSTRTSRCATTSTWSRTSSSGARRRPSGPAGLAPARRGRHGAADRRAAREPGGDDHRACAPRSARCRAGSASRWRSRARCWASRSS